MPVLKETTYQPTFPFKNSHFNTVYRAFTDKGTHHFNRQRLELSDGDFLDLDISSVGSNQVILAIHGLEGSAQSNYIQTLTRSANHAEIDVIALNLRGCSGEKNRLLATYHSGKTEDVDRVIGFILNNRKYDCIHLVGYSLGGNLILKFIGEGRLLSPKIRSAIGVSVPCDLQATAHNMSMLKNTLYLKMFLKSLIEKMKQKRVDFPDSFLKESAIHRIKNFEQFDNVFTAPANGFNDAVDYWTKCSCKQFIPNIKISSLLINALDDPFFDTSCYPYEEAAANPHFYLETPKYGGHVGFGRYLGKRHVNWVDQRILTFISSLHSE